MKQNLIALLCGILFGAGLSLSHMINPDKVLNFLDITGKWDPSLLLVMLGALPIPFLCFRIILKRPAPIFGDKFQLPGKMPVNTGLVIGSVIFGIGWGMSGYCPGPAITSLGLGSSESSIMVASIFLGFGFYNWIFLRN